MANALNHLLLTEPAYGFIQFDESGESKGFLMLTVTGVGILLCRWYCDGVIDSLQPVGPSRKIWGDGPLYAGDR